MKSQLSKIRGVLKASAVEGAPFVPHQVFQAEEVNCTPRTGTAQSVTTSNSSTERDLSTWRVSVPHVDGGGAQPLYMVSVHSVSEDKSWTVLRRDQDFYALRSRLSEFHGDKALNDSPLPSRKNTHPSLTANRQEFFFFFFIYNYYRFGKKSHTHTRTLSFFFLYNFYLQIFRCSL